MRNKLAKSLGYLHNVTHKDTGQVDQLRQETSSGLDGIKVDLATDHLQASYFQSNGGLKMHQSKAGDEAERIL